MNSLITEKQKQRDEIARKVEEYLKKGGKITVVDYAATGFVPMNMRQLHDKGRLLRSS